MPVVRGHCDPGGIVNWLQVITMYPLFVVAGESRVRTMPSFDVVSEVDLHQLTNAVDQAGRIIANRFDFKGVEASFEREERTVLITAEAEFQVSQMEDMLRSALIKCVKCDIDPAAMDCGEPQVSGKLVKSTVVLRHGLDSGQCKVIVKRIKEAKIKVQAQIQGEQVRVTGKKRDDLQQVIALLREEEFVREEEFGAPLQFTNFRD
jgi:uncharacterized protein YajQ (UPF0234 family)